MKTGEEEETVIYSQRSKLFRYTDGQWKERGIGDMKILKHNSTGTVSVDYFSLWFLYYLSYMHHLQIDILRFVALQTYRLFIDICRMSIFFQGASGC